MKRLKVALVGCGSIGSALARAVVGGSVPNAEISILYDADRSAAIRLSDGLEGHPRVAGDFEEVLASGANLVVEASSQAAVRELVPRALSSGRDVMMMSVGALTDSDLLERISRIAVEKGAKVYLPSGAIGGVDCVKAASVAGLTRVVLVTRKPPAALRGAPGTERLDLEAISEPLEVFSGTARDAVRLFPQNVNVAATLSLAGIGLDRTEVRVVADPLAKRNSHEITAEGAFGRMTVKVDNEPFPANPKTSHLAALSAIRRLISIGEAVEVGT